MRTYRAAVSPKHRWVSPVVLITALIASTVLAQAYRTPDAIPENVAVAPLAVLPINLPIPPSPPSPPSSTERMTILVLGVDSNGPRSTRFVGARSDTTILVTVDPTAKTIAVTSIPRDSRVFIKGLGMTKINAAHACGGPKLAVSTVSAAFGIPINHYVVIDTVGLRKVCELMGPLDVVVEKRMKYIDHAGRLYINLRPGRQRLSPAQVEQYVRFRHDKQSDIGRIQRQQWFIRQAVSKVYDPWFLCKLPQVLSIARDSIRTDLLLADLIRIAMSARESKPSDIFTASLPGQCATIGGVSYWILDLPNTRAIFKRIYGSETAESIEPLNERLRVAIEYAAGAEQDVLALEHSLVRLGYGVKIKRVVPAAECAHEQIVLSTAKVRRATTSHLRRSIPMIEGWPEVTAARHQGADLTFVVPRRKS